MHWLVTLGLAIHLVLVLVLLALMTVLAFQIHPAFGIATGLMLLGILCAAVGVALDR